MLCKSYRSIVGLTGPHGLIITCQRGVMSEGHFKLFKVISTFIFGRVLPNFFWGERGDAGMLVTTG